MHTPIVRLGAKLLVCDPVPLYVSLLTVVPLGTDDTTKDNVKAVIKEAHNLGGYQHLSHDQKQVLIDQLVLSREEEATGIVRWPQAQLQDARAVMERVRREVC